MPWVGKHPSPEWKLPSVEGTERFLALVARASEADWRDARLSWTLYNRLLNELALSVDSDFHTAVAVFAALSPNNSYVGNLRDTRRVLLAVREGRTADETLVTTYHNNKRKAFAIATGELTPLNALRFPKTRNFYLNICDPTDPNPVTVDGHIYNAWTGVRVALTTAAARFRVSQYYSVVADVREVARELGVIPNIAQAIIWFTWRRLHNIHQKPQQELWFGDATALGFNIPWSDQRYRLDKQEA